jgi:ABC-type transporter Mla MlaB component
MDVGNHEGFRTVRLAGRLQCEHVDELMRLCEESTPALRLDLTDLVSVDPSGLETLSLIRQRGAQVEGASPYIALQLERLGPARDRG